MESLGTLRGFGCHSNLRYFDRGRVDCVCRARSFAMKAQAAGENVSRTSVASGDVVGLVFMSTSHITEDNLLDRARHRRWPVQRR